MSVFRKKHTIDHTVYEVRNLSADAGVFKSELSDIYKKYCNSLRSPFQVRDLTGFSGVSLLYLSILHLLKGQPEDANRSILLASEVDPSSKLIHLFKQFSDSQGEMDNLVNLNIPRPDIVCSSALNKSDGYNQLHQYLTRICVAILDNYLVCHFPDETNLNIDCHMNEVRRQSKIRLYVIGCTYLSNILSTPDLLNYLSSITLIESDEEKLQQGINLILTTYNVSSLPIKICAKLCTDQAAILAYFDTISLHKETGPSLLLMPFLLGINVESTNKVLLMKSKAFFNAVMLLDFENINKNSSNNLDPKEACAIFKIFESGIKCIVDCNLSYSYDFSSNEIILWMLSKFIDGKPCCEQSIEYWTQLATSIGYNPDLFQLEKSTLSNCWHQMFFLTLFSEIPYIHETDSDDDGDGGSSVVSDEEEHAMTNLIL